MQLNQILTEKYLNIIGDTDRAKELKSKYSNIVWDLLQQSYKAIGGIKGNGFSSPEEMIEKIPFWKIGMRDGVPKAVILYKDKGGRKSVAMGTDGTPEASTMVSHIMSNEMYRSYGEKSKTALGRAMKEIPWEFLEPFVHKPDQVARILTKDKIVPLTSLDRVEWPADAVLTISKYPQLLDYGYLRELNGELTFKVMIGSPGKTIT